jgi:hypothetical protein
MGRKRRNKDQVPEHRDESQHDDRPRRGRRLALLLGLAGAAAYLVRRNRRKAELDEGIWHEAPATSTASATPASSATTPTPSA